MMDDKELTAKAQHLETMINHGDTRKLGIALLAEYLAMGSDGKEFGKLLERTKGLVDNDRKKYPFLPTISFTDPSGKNFEVDLERFAPGLSFLFTGAVAKQSSTTAFAVKADNPAVILGLPENNVGNAAGVQSTIVDGVKEQTSIGNTVLITQNGASAESFFPVPLEVARPGSSLTVSPLEDGKVCAESGAFVQAKSTTPTTDYAQFFAEPGSMIQGDVPIIPVPTGFCEHYLLPIMLREMAK